MANGFVNDNLRADGTLTAGTTVTATTTVTGTTGVIATTGNVAASDGDVTAAQDTAATAVVVSAIHTDNTSGSSHAKVIAQAGGASGGDAIHQAIIAGVNTWSWGADNSDTDAWVLSVGAALGTNNVIKCTVAGAVALSPIAGQNITLDGSTTLDGGVIANTGTITNTGDVTVTSTGTTTLTVTSTDAGAAATALVDVYRDSASPAAADVLGYAIFNGRDSAANKQEYARIEGRIISPTTTAETGGLDMYTINAGTATLQVRLLNTGGQYKGNNTNTTPPAGYIGELLTTTATAVAVSANVTANDTSQSVTAGQWDLCGYGQYGTTGTVAGNISTNFYLSATTASTTPTGESGLWNTGGAAPVNGYNAIAGRVGPTRLSLSATTTFYLNHYANASVTFTNVTVETATIRALRIG